jgi:hypothetical protein
MTLIQLMLVNGSVKRYKVHRRFWFFAALAVMLMVRVVTSIPVPDHLVTSIYWQGVI